MFGTIACGSGNDNNQGEGTGNAAADTQTTNSEVQSTTQAGVQQTAGTAQTMKFAAIESTSVACTGGGTAQVTGDVTSGSPTSFDLDFDFTDCTNLDGSVNVSGDINTSASHFEYVYTILGEAGGNGCLVTYDGFLIDVSLPDLTNPVDLTIIIDGSITGECESGNTTCDYDNLTIINGVQSGTAVCS
jgi:hypothetical protein